MRITHSTCKPDTLTAGEDCLLNTLNGHWEPVQDAYWSENIQRYYVMIGPLKGYGTILTYPAGAKVVTRRIYL